MKTVPGGIAFEDVRLEQDFPARAEDRRQHRRICLGAVDEDRQSMPGLQPMRSEAVAQTRRRLAPRVRLDLVRFVDLARPGTHPMIAAT